MKRLRAGTITVALTFVAAGVLLLMQQAGWRPWHLLRFAGPAVLIALGLEIVATRLAWGPRQFRYNSFSFLVAALAVLATVLTGFTPDGLPDLPAWVDDASAR